MLPNDVYGLIYLYAYPPQKLVEWVNPADIPGYLSYKRGDDLSILANPAGIHWAMKNLDKFTKTYKSKDGKNEIKVFEDPQKVFDVIAKNQSKYMIDLLELAATKVAKSYFDKTILESIKTLLASNPYGAHYIAKKLGVENHELRCELLSTNTETPILELITYYQKKIENIVVDKTERIMMAKNKFMWDIYKKIGNNTPTDILNESEQALKYYNKNPKEYQMKRSKIIAESIKNPRIKNGVMIAVRDSPNSIFAKDLKNLPLHMMIPYILSANSSDNSIDILLKHPNLMDLNMLPVNSNPRIIPILKANYTKLNYKILSICPLIFTQPKFAPKFVQKINHILSRQKFPM